MNEKGEDKDIREPREVIDDLLVFDPEAMEQGTARDWLTKMLSAVEGWKKQGYSNIRFKDCSCYDIKVIGTRIETMEEVEKRVERERQQLRREITSLMVGKDMADEWVPNLKRQLEELDK